MDSTLGLRKLLKHHLLQSNKQTIKRLRDKREKKPWAICNTKCSKTNQRMKKMWRILWLLDQQMCQKEYQQMQVKKDQNHWKWINKLKAKTELKTKKKNNIWRRFKEIEISKGHFRNSLLSFQVAHNGLTWTQFMKSRCKLFQSSSVRNSVIKILRHIWTIEIIL